MTTSDGPARPGRLEHRHLAARSRDLARTATFAPGSRVPITIT